jgi:hypothetical protein
MPGAIEKNQPGCDMKPTAPRRGPWLLVAALTVAMTALTTYQALIRYAEFDSGWSWDVAYYNQWFWAITKGDGMMTVLPIASYANPGPSVWKMIYVTALPFILIPFYALFPCPTTLLVSQNVVFWWCIPAGFRLVREESKSDSAALLATALISATPLLWILVWNDFRELQFAVPFILWAVDGVRGRNFWLSVLGIGGMLSCREEFAIVVASLAFLPAREPEEMARTYRWARVLLLLGLAWFFMVFFGFLRLMYTPGTPRLYFEQFGDHTPIVMKLRGILKILVIGMGPWTILALFAPRTMILAMPWYWSLVSGLWSIDVMGDERWTHVRYASPGVSMLLAAGLIGFAKLAGRLEGRRRLLAAVWVVLLCGLLWARADLVGRLSRIPPPVARADAPELWDWIRRARRDEGVLTSYRLSGPLSSRKYLYVYNMFGWNVPPGYPGRLDPKVNWIFWETKHSEPVDFTDQGFDRVARSSSVSIYHRRRSPTAEGRER